VQHGSEARVLCAQWGREGTQLRLVELQHFEALAVVAEGRGELPPLVEHVALGFERTGPRDALVGRQHLVLALTLGGQCGLGRLGAEQVQVEQAVRVRRNARGTA
jgi:hypothetical protein